MKTLKFVSLILVILCTTLSKVWGDGFIIPQPISPAPQPSMSYFKIKYHYVDVNIENQVAQVKITQSFENVGNSTVEGRYIFPLPESAAITDFVLIQNGKEIKGRILKKEEAAKIYADIVRKQKDPALLEYVGLNAFSAKVFPIAVGKEAKVEIKYSQILKKKNDLVEFIYPLNTEKFSVQNLESVSVRVLINSKFPLGNIYSPSHNIAKTVYNQNKAGISYEEKNTKPDKDFVLYYSENNKNLNFNLLTYTPDENYFMLLLSPQIKKITKEDILKKRIIFVFDTSGSMAGEKLEQAKKALKFCINSLVEEDEFNLIDFHSEVNKLSPDLLLANAENKNKSLKYVDNLFASGGTNINDALFSALKIPESKTKPTYIIFLTDGLPTVGEVDTNNILKNIKNANKNVRIFVFGVGYDVNTTLLDKIAEQNKGDREYIKEGESLEEKVSNFYKEIQSPALTNITLTATNVNLKEIYPRVIPDLFYGGEMILLGKYSGYGNSKIKISGQQGTEKKSYIFDFSFPKDQNKYDFIDDLWAARRIGYLIDDIRLNGENEEIIEEIIALSKKFGIITPYTSFLADEEVPLAMSKEEEKKIYTKMAPKNGNSGAGAVDLSVAGSNAQKTKVVNNNFGIYDKAKDDPNSILNNLRTIANLSFIYKNKIWIQSNYQNEKTKKIRFASQEYFDLLNDNSQVAKILSLGEKIIFQYKNVWYEITDEKVINEGNLMLEVKFFFYLCLVLIFRKILKQKIKIFS